MDLDAERTEQRAKSKTMQDTDVASEETDKPSTFPILLALIFCSADDKDIEGGADIPQVASKPKPRPVLKRKVTEENSGAGGEELEDDNPFGMSYAK